MRRHHFAIHTSSFTPQSAEPPVVNSLRKLPTITENYQNITACILRNYHSVTPTLPTSYTRITATLQRSYCCITQRLVSDYMGITEQNSVSILRNYHKGSPSRLGMALPKWPRVRFPVWSRFLHVPITCPRFDPRGGHFCRLSPVRFSLLARSKRDSQGGPEFESGSGRGRNYQRPCVILL